MSILVTLKEQELWIWLNKIYNHFKKNEKFDITGYDHVGIKEYGSVTRDISSLPDENDSVNICIFSQSLMGSNWRDYLDEGNRVLIYNGEMIVSESKDRHGIVKEYLEKIGMKIKKDDFNEKIAGLQS